MSRLQKLVCSTRADDISWRSVHIHMAGFHGSREHVIEGQGCAGFDHAIVQASMLWRYTYLKLAVRIFDRTFSLLSISCWHKHVNYIEYEGAKLLPLELFAYY